jgi:8-oxo-dGTP diphosphatase
MDSLMTNDDVWYYERMEHPNVRVGIGVFLIKEGKFLIQKRQGSHGEGTWSLPGGHLEFGESFEDTARREVKEETNLTIKNVRFAAVTNDIFADENKHYATIWVLSEWESGELTNMEPNKCTEQRWITLEELPEPLFLPWKQLLVSEFIDDIKSQLKTQSV